MNSPDIVQFPVEETTTPELVKQALADVRELIAIEVQLALKEARLELLQAKRAVVSYIVALSFALLGLSVSLFALILVLGNTVVHALIVAILLILVCAACLAYSRSTFPKKFLDRTRRRFKDDVLASRSIWFD